MTRDRRRTHYLIAVIILAICASGLQVANSIGYFVVVKKPLPIRKPLKDLERKCVTPLAFVSSDTMSDEVVAELGTTEYVSWLLNEAAPNGSPSSPVRLSVTYYTGKVDQVPHVPEECIYQGGMDPGGDDDTLTLRVPNHEGDIPLRRLSFRPRAGDGSKVYDYYTICVNNKYFSTRDWARLEMSSRRATHMFYSKIEVMYPGGPGGGKLEDLDQRAMKLIGRVIEELTRTHYPLRGWEQGGPTAI